MVCGKKGGTKWNRGQRLRTNENLFLKLKRFSQTLVLPQMKTHREEVMKVDYCLSGLLEAWRGLALIPIEPSHLALPFPCNSLIAQGFGTFSTLIPASAGSRWQGLPGEGK